MLTWKSRVEAALAGYKPWGKPIPLNPVIVRMIRNTSTDPEHFDRMRAMYKGYHRARYEATKRIWYPFKRRG